MIKILFICHGNICRSPMAEFVFKNMLATAGLSDQVYVASAATSTEEIWNGTGNPVYPPAKAELAKHGIGCEGKRAVQIQKKDYAEYDYLIGMEAMNIRNIKRIVGEDTEHKISLLLDFTDRKGEEIADPWYTGKFALTYQDIEEGCTGLLKHLEAKITDRR